MNQIIFVLATVGLAASATLPTQYLPPKTGPSYHESSGSSGIHQISGTHQISGNSFQQASRNSFQQASRSSFVQPAQVSTGFVAQAVKYNTAPQVPILRLDNENTGDGTYRYAYETGDGTQAQEQGQLHGESVEAQGSFAFTAPDGVQYSIVYTAGENGFQPQGAHLPTPPPIPVEILKALEQNAADEARGIIDDGQYRPEAEEAGYKAYQTKQTVASFAQSGGYKY